MFPDHAIDLFSPQALPEIFSACWQQLVSAVQSREHGWRLPVLATIHTNEIAQRTVVLRSAERSAARLLFHTDSRSAKVAQIAAHPGVSLLFYDSSLQMQLRVSAKAVVHQDGLIADHLWETSGLSSLNMYLAPRVPGTQCKQADRNLPDEVVRHLAIKEQIEAARRNFSVIEIRASEIEWLRLSADGQLRARWWAKDGTDAFEWLSP